MPARVLRAAREHAFRFLDLGEDAQAVLVVGAPVEGGADLAGGALQQARAQVAFQLLDQRGRRGARHGELFGRLAEAAEFDDAHEQLHGLQTVHG
ncbi:hypothetical protein D3C86_1409550 [compost metagenome]